MDENLWMWMKMGIERWRSTDWWSCKAGPGSMADASFCNGQYIPGSTPYPTPPEDTFLSSYSFSHHIFVMCNIFQGAPPILFLQKIQFYLHILSVFIFFSFCNGQYIPGSTPYPTPPEDTFLSSYSLCHHILKRAKFISICTVASDFDWTMNMGAFDWTWGDSDVSV